MTIEFSLEVSKICIFSQIIAHEIGHNLNMLHDFADDTPGVTRFCDTDGSSCTNDGGVMDYSQVITFHFKYQEY